MRLLHRAGLYSTSRARCAAGWLATAMSCASPLIVEAEPASLSCNKAARRYAGSHRVSCSQLAIRGAVAVKSSRGCRITKENRRRDRRGAPARDGRTRRRLRPNPSTHILTAADWIPSRRPTRPGSRRATEPRSRRGVALVLPPTPTGPPRLLPSGMGSDPSRPTPTDCAQGHACLRPGPRVGVIAAIIPALNASPAVVYRVRKQPVEEPSRR